MPLLAKFRQRTPFFAEKSPNSLNATRKGFLFELAENSAYFSYEELRRILKAATYPVPVIFGIGSVDEIPKCFRKTLRISCIRFSVFAVHRLAGKVPSNSGLDSATKVFHARLAVSFLLSASPNSA